MDFLFEQVKLTGGFLKFRQDTNLKTTIHAVYNRFVDTGRFGALECKWTPGSDLPSPHVFYDSDVAKWIEGASYLIARQPDSELEARIEAAIDAIEANQLPDGYFNSYYLTHPEEPRFSKRNNHELYCAGHLMEAAVAYFYATGKDRFLKIMEKYADLINRIFIVEHSAAFDMPGHEEIEIALLRMYRCTGKEQYLDMCKHFVLKRGTSPKDAPITEWVNLAYDQCEKSVYELESARGHAVRAAYLYTAMADLATETGDDRLLSACRRLFADITEGKMYITGGVGSTHIGEAYTIPYDLPAETAYAETCAAIALMFFAQKLLLAEPDGKYADIVEKVLYNGMMSGMSIEGDSFFYENALEINTSNSLRNNATERKDRFPITQRKKVFDCSCCPPNLNRVLASLEQYLYHTSDDTFYVDQYCDSEYRDGTIQVRQETAYPLTGEITLHFEGVQKAALRIPGWCDHFTLDVPYELKDGYAYLSNPGTVTLHLDMQPKLISANPEVNYCTNKAALMMGPVVYCAERIDNDCNLHRLYFALTLNADITYCDTCKLNKLEVDGYQRQASGALYENLRNDFTPVRIRLIPYYAYANRGETDMLVWMGYRQ